MLVLIGGFLLYIISHKNLILNPDEEWYNHEILVFNESFTSFALCFLNVL